MKITGSILLLLLIGIYSCRAQQTGNTLDAASFNEKIKSTGNSIVLDVRTPGEFSKGFIRNARNIDYNSGNFETEAGKLDKSKTYFVYCLSGGRSASAASYMRSNGFKNVYELKGGILAWQKNNLPIATASAVPPADKISMDDYKKIISSDSVVLIDFYAPWCAPCKKMEPMMEELSKEYQGKVKIIRLNIDENKQLAKQLGVEEIPILKLFRYRKETWMHKGFITKEELQKAIGS